MRKKDKVIAKQKVIKPHLGGKKRFEFVEPGEVFEVDLHANEGYWLRRLARGEVELYKAPETKAKEAVK